MAEVVQQLAQPGIDKSPQFPSPLSSASVTQRKRPRADSQDPARDITRDIAQDIASDIAHQGNGFKRAKITTLPDVPLTPDISPKAQFFTDIAHWADTSHWPSDFAKQRTAMSSGPKRVRSLSESDDETQSGTPKAHRIIYIKQLAEHGISMNFSPLLDATSSKDCSKLLEGTRESLVYSTIPPAEFVQALNRVRWLNEARIQRDITPWIVPSPELLHLWGEPGLQHIGEEINADWNWCESMGGTRPKPDMTVGLLPSALTATETKKLHYHATPKRPFHFTAQLCFPFLTCEAKSGEQGLNKADRQNAHSAAIALRAIFELYGDAYGDDSQQRRDLMGQVLVFSISHDHDKVVIYGHYSVVNAATGQQEYYRHHMRMLSLLDDDQRLKPYNFVRNLYEKFAPLHLKRIQDAVAALPEIIEAPPAPPKDSSGTPRSASQTEEDSAFRVPNLPETVSLRTELAKLMEKNHAMMERMSELQERSEERLRQQQERSDEQLSKEQERSLRLEEQLMRFITEKSQPRDALH